jgi:hypothetical protein
MGAYAAADNVLIEGTPVSCSKATCEPYLDYTAHTLVDCGNFDGTVQPGETVRIWPEVLNIGAQDAVNADGTLTLTPPPTPGITITTDFATYPPVISSGKSEEPDDPGFEFTVNPAVPCGTTIDFTLDMNYPPYFNSTSFQVEVVGSFGAGGGSPTNVALFKDVVPWSPSNADVLTANGIPFTIFTSANMGVVDLSSFDKVVIAGNQPQVFYDALVANKAWFEAWISAGGVFEMHAANNVGPALDSYVFPGDFSTFFVMSEGVEIIDPAHPVVTTPNPITDTGKALDGWNSSTHAYIDLSPPGANTILDDDDVNPGQPVAQEWLFGGGAVVVSTQTLEYAWGNGISPILENFLLYMQVSCDPVSCIAEPALRYDSHFVDDSFGGNLNGLFNPGETNLLQVTLENPSWLAGATNTSAVLSTTEPGVTIFDDTAFYNNNIPPSGFGASKDPHYQVSIDPAVPCGTVLDFTLDITANEGSWTDTFTVQVDPGTCGAAPFFDDMESGINGWTVQPPADPNNLWHQQSSGLCFPESTSGVTSWYFGQDGICNFSNGSPVTGSLVSPVLCNVVPGSVLDFWYRRNTECGAGCCGWDDAFVDISVDGGPFVPIAQMCNDDDMWVYTGGTGESVDLSAYAGPDMQIAFRFDSYDGAGNDKVGWMVDDVLVDGSLVTPCEGYVPCPDDLSAAPTCSPPNICPGNSVSFTANASGGTPPYNYLWNFGNGDTSTEADPTYTYISSSFYTVTLQVTDSCGYIPKVWGPNTTCSISVFDPSATLTDSPDPVEAGQDVQFTASPSGGTGGPYAFEWDFENDGTPDSSLQNPTYSYGSPGTYNYTVTVTDLPGGCSSILSGTIQRV